MKPVIGIMPLFDTNKNSIWMLKDYLDAIEKSNGIPLVLPLNSNENDIKELDKMIDGYLFIGGNDLDKSLHGDLVKQELNVKDTIEIMERIYYFLAKEENKPLFGICRGMEIINLLEGGTIYNDLSIEHPTAEIHMQKEPFNRPSHTNIILLETPLNRLLNTERLSVNSYHKRGIKQLAKGLRIMAMALDDLIEGVYDKKRLFLWGVEWHPELSFDSESSQKIFKEFIDKSIEWHEKNGESN